MKWASLCVRMARMYSMHRWTDWCLFVQSESIRRYIIIIYIDDDMMLHPVFFNQIIIVCINRRLWLWERWAKKSRSSGRVRVIDWSRILFDRTYNLFVICLTFFSHQMPKTFMDNEFHWIVLTVPVALFIYLSNDFFCLTSFVLASSQRVMIKISKKLMPVQKQKLTYKRKNQFKNISFGFRFCLVHFSCLTHIYFFVIRFLQSIH